MACRSHGLGLDSVLGDMPSKRAGKEEGRVFTHFSSKLQNATEPLVSAAYIILRFLPFFFVFLFLVSRMGAEEWGFSNTSVFIV